MTFGSEPTWTEDRITELRRLTAEGLSASQIAPLMGVSRNAIIGAWHRNGITSTRAPGPTPTKRKYKPRALHWTSFPKRKSPDRKPPMIAQPQAGEVVPLNISFEDLQTGQCKFPYGNTTPYLFCGQPTADDLSYCRVHNNACRSHSSGPHPHYARMMRRLTHPSKQILASIEPTSPEQLPDVA